MASLIYQGKINRQFWGKLIRQSTQSETSTRLQKVTWGGPFNPNLSNKITFFSCVKKNRIENYSILL